MLCCMYIWELMRKLTITALLFYSLSDAFSHAFPFVVFAVQNIVFLILYFLVCLLNVVCYMETKYCLVFDLLA